MWSHKTGPTVPSRVSLLILPDQAESGAYSRIPFVPPTFHDGVQLNTVSHHRVNPEFIRLRNCVPMTFSAESPPAQGQ